MQATEPAALVFSYEDAAAHHLVLSVAKATGGGRIDASLAAPAGYSVTWQRHGTIYALGGTLDLRRLNMIATVLQTEEDADEAPE